MVGGSDTNGVLIKFFYGFQRFMVSIQNVVYADFDPNHRDKTTVPVTPHNTRSQPSKEYFPDKSDPDQNTIKSWRQSLRRGMSLDCTSPCRRA